MSRAMSLMKRSLLAASVIALCACQAHWTKAAGEYKRAGDRYTIQVPENWRRNTGAKTYLLLTRDGLPLQRIVIIRRIVDERMSVTEMNFYKGMEPDEAAEAVAHDLMLDDGFSDFVVKERTAATVAGAPGFKIVGSYRTPETKLKKTILIYGVIVNRSFYQLIYDAPDRYYYGKNLPDFEAFKDSIRLTGSECVKNPPLEC